MTPWDCLPEHIDESHEWDGYDDDDHWFTKWRKHVKGWFAIGNAADRSKYSWANWRKYPIVLAKAGCTDWWRWEDDQHDILSITQPIRSYLSRVQYNMKWHIALQWPLFLHGHYKARQFYAGCKRDADSVYWLSLYLGRAWK